MLDSASQQVECEAFLSFVFIMAGIVLPIALLLATEPPQSLAKWEDGQRGGEGGWRAWGGGDRQGSGSGSSSGASGGGGLCGRSLHRLRAACGVAAAAVEGAIRRLCRRSWLASGPAEALEAVPRSHPQELMVSGGAFEWGPLRGWKLLVAWWILLFLLWALTFIAAV